MTSLVIVTTILLAISLLIYFLLILIGFIKKVWLNPIHIKYLMSSQGIKGPSYRFLHGNTKEIMSMRRETMEKGMDGMSHDIFPRILPHVHSWAKLYGN